MDIEKLAMELSRVLAIEMGFADGDKDAFNDWLRGFSLPEEWISSREIPNHAPDAITLDYNREASYQWYREDSSVLGFFLPTGAIHYVIPDEAVPPKIKNYRVCLPPAWVPGPEEIGGAL
jgi:hypothetical protein